MLTGIVLNNKTKLPVYCKCKIIAYMYYCVFCKMDKNVRLNIVIAGKLAFMSLYQR